jgi:hypothetical protein
LLQISGGDVFSLFLTRPLSVAMLVLTVFLLACGRPEDKA